MSRASAFIDRMGENAILYNRTLGAPDPITGWPSETWGVGVPIKIFVDEILTREDDSFRGGRITLKRMKAFSKVEDGVNYRDQVLYPTFALQAFFVESVTTIEYLYGAAQFRRVILVRFTE